MPNNVGKSKGLIDEVHRRIGRNLLRFQEMETCLRMILPYAHPDAAAKGAEASKKYRERNVAKKSLGHLIEQYRESIICSEGSVDDGLSKVLDSRNELVHHFHQLEDVNFLKPGSLEKAIEYLDQQFDATEEWHRVLVAQGLAVLLSLMESNEKLAAEYAPYRDRLLQRLKSFEDIVVIGGGNGDILNFRPSR